ncbi:major capsid protein [Methylobacterium organophilum]|uniref:major capsid protein n=1 Tax=Methylobacterium organophilum TaxID=410 RepID=UPI001F12E352|nr:major capsid protein [Methylobacterium organophilum]UMY16654.1 major capsid protein [Methylobacterium organophilum]
MATPLDLLRAPAFAANRLTESINIPPYATGRPAQLGIFRDTPINTTYVKAALIDGQITIIPSRERGGPGNKNMRGDFREVQFPIPHFPLDDAITPSDMQNLLVYGSDYVFQTLASVFNTKLESVREKHDATHSHLDWGALNGLVLDASGRQLLNLFTTFDITQTVVPFGLDSASTDVPAKNRVVKSAIRKALRGTGSASVRVLAGPTFFDKYVGHISVKEGLKYYAGPTANPARDEVNDVFTFAGLTIERVDEDFYYRQADGTFAVRDAVADNEAIAIPLGTPFFKRYVAPPDTIQDANIPPSTKIFVSTDELPHGKGLDLHTESNVLPVCLRPDLIVKLTAN